ncbi:MAG: organomercurial lyase [Verrucomicrobiia bacterium]
MNAPAKIAVVLLVAAAAAAVVTLKKTHRASRSDAASPGPAAISRSAAVEVPLSPGTLPKLLDLGADKCIPCKMMAPILEELRKEYAGKLEVVFIDVWKDPDAAKPYGIDVIPTQIFYDATGKERFRHSGFFGKEDILSKWRELGVNLQSGQPAAIVRETPVAADARPRDTVCFMCDGDVNPKTKTVVQGQSERRILCEPHCYFIYFSSIVGADPALEDPKVSATDWPSGNLVPAISATWLYGMDRNGRPTLMAFAEKAAAQKAQQASPGNLLSWEMLRAKEMAIRCAFCDRAVYPEDACGVKIGTARAYGCCTHCSLGVAARLKQDIEVEAKDGLTGEAIRVRTLEGQIALIEPATAVAWFGQKRSAEGKWVSAGCFKQGFFVNQENLGKWLDARPSMTGRQITIAQGLADKMKLTPSQIAGACKLGECK